MQALVTAPSDADETSFAYFAITPRLVPRRGRLPLRAALVEIGVHVEPPRAHVERDHVAVAHERDRAAVRRFRRHVADHQAVRGAAEAAVGDQRDRFAEPLADERAGHGEHFAHARTALRAFVADHHHVARLDLALLHGLEAGFFRIEHARGAAVKHSFVAGQASPRSLRERASRAESRGRRPS